MKSIREIYKNWKTSLRDAHDAGIRRGVLEATSRNYVCAVPNFIGSEKGISDLLERCDGTTNKTREMARKEAEKIRLPTGIIRRVVYRFGYLNI